MDKFEKEINENIDFHRNILKQAKKKDVELVASACLASFEMALHIYRKSLSEKKEG